MGNLPISESVFDVVAGGVDKHATLVPCSTLHTDVLMDCTQVLQLTVADGDH